MKPIIVFDNIIYSLQKTGGISAFWKNLTERVEASGLFDCHYIEYPGADNNIFRRQIYISSEKIIAGRHLPFSVERITEPYIPPEFISRPFIFHSSYYRIFSHKQALNVSTFHDLTHEHGGDGNFLTRPLMRKLHERALKKSDRVVCVSQNCLNDIKTFFPKIDTDKISVAYNAPVNTFITEESVDSSNYLLYVGARDDYKNFLFAVEVAAASGLTLRVAGAPFTSSERRKISSIKGAKTELHCYPNEKELCELYAGARALIFMSEYEGFGIPIVEAQSLGSPVIALRRSAIPEIAGKGAIIFDDLDVASAAKAVNRLSEKEFRNDMIRLGHENLRRFSWDATASHYIKIYKSLLKSRRI